jgi:sulfonate transport system ATP-binding protein
MVDPRALAFGGEVYYMDEPFRGIDAAGREELIPKIRAEIKEKLTFLVTHDIDEAIFLGDRVVVMSQRPSTIKSVIPVDLPRPRDRNSLDFVKLRRNIYTEFFAEVEVPFAYSI